MADGTAQCCCTSGFMGANCENAGKNLVMWKYIGKIELNTGKPLYLFISFVAEISRSSHLEFSVKKGSDVETRFWPHLWYH
jgi:hypothetical protein